MPARHPRRSLLQEFNPFTSAAAKLALVRTYHTVTWEEGNYGVDALSRLRG